MRTYTTLGYGDEATWGGRTPYQAASNFEELALAELEDDFCADAYPATLEYLDDTHMYLKTIIEYMAANKAIPQQLIDSMMLELRVAVICANSLYQQKNLSKKIKQLEEKAADRW